MFYVTLFLLPNNKYLLNVRAAVYLAFVSCS